MSGAKHVLLAEDDALSARIMRDVLQAHGFETTELTDGASAVARAAQGDIDLVVMDIGLPELDGVEATRRLKSSPKTRDLPIVAVTAYAMAEDEKRMRDAGCDAFMTKPLALSEFVAVVKALAAATSPGER